MIYLGKTSVGIAAITAGDTPNMADLEIVLYNSSYQPYVTAGKYIYSSQKYTCWVQ